MAMSLDSFYASHRGPTLGSLVPQPGGGYLTEDVEFDSFEGFPEGTFAEEHPIYVQGHVKTNEEEFLNLLREYGQSVERVRLVSGFYSESLTSALADEFRSRNLRASLVCMDCNLYESYRDALAWWDEFLRPGAIVYLDDFNTFRAQNNRGPRKAWSEYLESSRWNFDQFLNIGWAGRSFVVQGQD